MTELPLSPIAQALLTIYEQRGSDKDVTGHIACPRCGSRLTFSVKPSGESNGRCVAAGCLRWWQ